ncbi:MAG TPA: glycosyltransferase family 39 protein [Chloroflexota bacterium]|nr:glycosyltransferase family 39 protein [Chloroflexota bacterium]
MGPLAVILAVALGLRLFELTGQSLWYDEGVSAYMTPRSFAEIASATSVDIHPPLYYWLLSLWAMPFGQGEVALRGFSVLLGTLMVWATCGLGRALGGRAVGLAAGALLAVSPLAVQYSQEVRMYPLAGLLAVASSWAGLALLRALQDDGTERRRIVLLAVGYGLLAGALLYTHYYGTLVVAAQQLYAGLTVLTTRRWRIVPVWALASGLAVLLFLPWLPVALRQTGYYPGLGSPQPAWALVLDAVNVLSIGIATTRFGFRAGLAPFLGLAALGGWRMGREVTFLLLWLLIPIVGIVILSRSRPLYEPRFLMLVLPAWTILVGAGLVALGGVAGRILGGSLGLPPVARQLVVVAVGVVVAGLLLIPTARSLASYYFDPTYARDDYRGLAQTVALREQPGDAIVLTAPGQVEIFGYYYRGRSDLFPLPLQRPIDPTDTRARLEAVGGEHDRVWLVRWAANEADPDDLILTWLEGRGRRIGSQQFGRVELRLYDLRATARTTLTPALSQRERAPRSQREPGGSG